MHMRHSEQLKTRHISEIKFVDFYCVYVNEQKMSKQLLTEKVRDLCEMASTGKIDIKFLAKTGYC